MGDMVMNEVYTTALENLIFTSDDVALTRFSTNLLNKALAAIPDSNSFAISLDIDDTQIRHLSVITDMESALAASQGTVYTALNGALVQSDTGVNALALTFHNQIVASLQAEIDALKAQLPKPKSTRSSTSISDALRFTSARKIEAQQWGITRENYMDMLAAGTIEAERVRRESVKSAGTNRVELGVNLPSRKSGYVK
jgi:uncharacterized small protein (DUF1192 family)